MREKAMASVQLEPPGRSLPIVYLVGTTPPERGLNTHERVLDGDDSCVSDCVVGRALIGGTESTPNGGRTMPLSLRQKIHLVVGRKFYGTPCAPLVA